MSLRVLMITSEWPTPEHPEWVPFVVRQVEFLRRSGIDVDVFQFRGEGSPRKYFRAWREARSKLRHGDYDLIHCQWGQSAIAALPCRLPLIVTFRGSDLQGFTAADGSWLSGVVLSGVSRLIARRADERIIVSETLARLLPKRPYHVIPSGLDLGLFRPTPREQARKALGLPLDDRLVLFTGARDKPNKRYDLARDAVARLAGSCRARLILANDVPHTAMPTYMSACDALLLTSVHEGSPNVVKEALACDLPIVSTDVGDVRHRIRDIEGCVVCDDDRPETVAAGLAGVIEPPHRTEGRAAVRDLDENDLTQKVIAVYHQAVANRARS